MKKSIKLVKEPIPRRMLVFLRFIENQQFFLRTHSMMTHTFKDPEFINKCNSLDLLHEDAEGHCLLEMTRPATAPIISIVFVVLLTCFLFLIDFSAGQEMGRVARPGMIHVTLLVIIALLIIYAIISFPGRHMRFLFTEEVLFICRQGMFHWKIHSVHLENIQDVISLNRKKRFRTRHLCIIDPNGNRQIIASSNDDASVDWLRWAMFYWLGKAWQSEEEEMHDQHYKKLKRI